MALYLSSNVHITAATLHLQKPHLISNRSIPPSPQTDFGACRQPLTPAIHVAIKIMSNPACKQTAALHLVLVLAVMTASAPHKSMRVVCMHAVCFCAIGVAIKAGALFLERTCVVMTCTPVWAPRGAARCRPNLCPSVRKLFPWAALAFLWRGAGNKAKRTVLSYELRRITDLTDGSFVAMQCMHARAGGRGR